MSADEILAIAEGELARMVQTEKCSRGEHEPIPDYNVSSAVFRDDGSHIGYLTQKLCKHCRCLYVEAK